MRFWLDRGVDGFRVDVASGLIRDERLRDNAPFQLRGWPRRRNWDLEEVHDIHRRWRKVLDSYDGERMAVGEIGVRDLRRHVRYYGNDDELQLSFNFHFLEQPWIAERFRSVVEEWERLLPQHAWPDYTLSNHDRSRAVSRYGAERAGAAAVMLLTLRGTPFIYYGEEIGMTDVPIPAERVVDIDGRDPERTPMQWDASLNAGFTTGDPWLPLATDHAKRNVAAQRDDPGSLFSLYRRMVWLRKSSPALRRGAYRTIPAARGVFSFGRQADDERVLVALNFTKVPQQVSLDSGTGRVLLSTDHTRDGEEVDLQRLALGPDEGVVLTPAPGPQHRAPRP
jgi:alpha-glucosidase